MWKEGLFDTGAVRKILLAVLFDCLYIFLARYVYQLGGMLGFVIVHTVFSVLVFCAYVKINRGTDLFARKDPWLTCRFPAFVFLLIFIGFYLFGIFQVQYNIREVFQWSARVIVIDTLAALSTGIFEETLCRGFLGSALIQLSSKRKHPCIIAAVGSSLIFGALHLMNYDGSNLSDVLIQVFYAAMIGLAFFALRVLSNGMFLPILCHFLIDWQTGIMSGTPDQGSFLPYLIIFLPLGILSIVMIYICEHNMQKEIEQQ